MKLGSLKTDSEPSHMLSPVYYPLLASTVLWYVIKTPVVISLFIEQLFADCPGHNCEPIRKVFYSHHTCTLHAENTENR